MRYWWISWKNPSSFNDHGWNIFVSSPVKQWPRTRFECISSFSMTAVLKRFLTCSSPWNMSSFYSSLALHLTSDIRWSPIYSPKYSGYRQWQHYIVGNTDYSFFHTEKGKPLIRCRRNTTSNFKTTPYICNNIWLQWNYGFQREKKEENWLSPMTEAPTPTEKIPKNIETIQKTPSKTSITQRLRTDLGRSVGVTAVTPLVW